MTNLPAKADVSDYQTLLTLASDLVKTGFLPQAVRTPAQAVAIILTGREMGIGVMQSLRGISIIKGKPVIQADLQLALFHDGGGKSEWKEMEDNTVTLWLRHPCGVEHSETYTIEDATRAFAGSLPDNYKKHPKAMLRSRAITAGLKSVGFLLTTGSYDPTEALHFQDNGGVTAEVVSVEDAFPEVETAPTIPWGKYQGMAPKDVDNTAYLNRVKEWCETKNSDGHWDALLADIATALAEREEAAEASVEEHTEHLSRGA